MRPEANLSPKTLTLVCAKCTRAAEFAVSDVNETGRAIAEAGWIQRDGKTVCPKCPQTRDELKQRSWIKNRTAHA
jgi:hypothetical protein